MSPSGGVPRRANGWLGVLLVLVLVLGAASCGATGGDEPITTPEASAALLASCEGGEEPVDPPAMAATVAAAWLDHEDRGALDVGEVVAAHGCTEHGLWGTVRSPANLVVLLVEPGDEPVLASMSEVAAACADERLPAPLRSQLGC
ncbi:MAG: hypothetical protein JJU45_15725 [Acidimicrobiia bacterium]|nr:hypothetical protein [Acidimicrobiia bacterium]